MQIAKKRLGTLLLAACLLIALAFGGVTAWAASAGTGENTLKVGLTADPTKDIEKASVTVDVYRIGSANEVSGYDTYEYAFDEAPFTDLQKSYTPDSMTGAKWQELATQAAGMIGDAKPLVDKVPVGEDIEGLTDGLYLVVAADAHSDLNMYTFNPTIVAMPAKEPLKDDQGNVITDEDGFPIVSSAQNYGEWIHAAEIALKWERTPLVGRLQLIKTIKTTTGDAATCTFLIKSTPESPVEYENTASYTFAEVGTYNDRYVTNIPAGAIVTVTETYPGAGYKMVSDDPAPKTIVADVLVDEGKAEVPSAAFENAPSGSPERGHGIENQFTLEKTGEGDSDWDWVWYQVPANTPSN